MKKRKKKEKKIRKKFNASITYILLFTIVIYNIVIYNDITMILILTVFFLFQDLTLSDSRISINLKRKMVITSMVISYRRKIIDI